jgi:predicted AlkP superfamily phosphohydrolase/phosphomutase/tetratricopeptide (TPR) repeat protein
MISCPKVLLVGWDAADWKVIHPLMDAGQMPNVQRLVENGSIAQIATLNPPLSPMLWTSIATGKRPFKHGIWGFSEPTPDGNSVQPVSNLSRKCKAVWNILNQNGLRSVVIGWWPSHPAEPLDGGVMVSDHFHKSFGPLEKGWPVMPASVYPWELAETIAEFRLHPDEVAGEMIDFFVPKAREIDQKKDRRLASIAKTLCDCVSVHGAATWLLENHACDLFAVYYDSIDHFSHGFMRYHPPRQPQIPERDFELYHNVVSAGYRFHDQMLGALLARIGPETRVVLMSDHGFHPDHLRPRSIPQIPAGPAIEHRDFGVLALAGPGIRKDELLHGASVLDITPTVLQMFGLPIGEDMDGKILTGAFEEPPHIATIPSWEDVAGQDGRHPPHTRLDPEAARESLEQLVALGYIEKPDENREKAVANTLNELHYNLGEAYQDAGRHSEALELFRQLYRADPDEQRFAVHLFVSCQALGLTGEMRAIVDALDGPRREKFAQAQKRASEMLETARERAKQRKAKAEEREEPKEEEHKGESLLTPEEKKEFAEVKRLLNFQPPVVDYLKGQVFAAERKWGEALDCLGRVEQAHMARPGLFLQTAALYQKLKQWEDAERMYQRALSVDPDNPHAHIGMCRAAIRRRDFAAAAQSALDGLQRLYHNPVGHFLLGVSLVGLGDYERARDAFETALSLNPNFRQAHLRLAYLFKRRLHDDARAAEHFRLFREMRAAARQKAQKEMQHRDRLPQPPSAPEPASEPARDQVLPPLGPEEVVVISGLPRSGTSMLMQMVTAGGVPALTDGQREADEDNPRGYFEYEPVKQLLRSHDWFPEARNKAVKIVAPLLVGLPPGVPCRVIFIDRNLEEILASQREMLRRHGKAGEDDPARHARLKVHYGQTVLRVKKFLEQRGRTHVLRLHRDAILADPRTAAESINRFLGGGWNVEAMATEVKPAMHHQRANALLA